MKLSNLIIIALLAVIAYYTADESMRKRSAEQSAAILKTNRQQMRAEETHRELAAMTTPIPTRTGPISKSELVLVRGRVLPTSADRMTVDCSDPPAGAGYRVSASDGAGASRNLAMLALEEEMKKYGPLWAVEGGALIQTSFNAPNRAEGVVTLMTPYGPQIMHAGRVRAIAAPADNSGVTFTMDFQLVGLDPKQKNKDWMWQDGPMNAPIKRR